MRRRANTDPMCACGRGPKGANFGVCKACNAERMRERRRLARERGDTSESVAGVHVTAADRAALLDVAPSVPHGKLRKHWTEKPCSHCGKPRDVSYSAYCLACKAAYQRAYRPKHSELTPEQRKRANCRAYTNVLIRRGHLIPQPCEVCGSLDVQPHHTNYDDPRAVRWHCKAHHLDEHLGPVIEDDAARATKGQG